MYKVIATNILYTYGFYVKLSKSLTRSYTMSVFYYIIMMCMSICKSQKIIGLYLAYILTQFELLIFKRGPLHLKGEEKDYKRHSKHIETYYDNNKGLFRGFTYFKSRGIYGRRGFCTSLKKNFIRTETATAAINEIQN